jgi:hypothetical protein
MAVALILDFPGATKEQYDEVMKRMELGGQMAEGGLFHAAGSYDGGWRVVDVWADMATFEHFRDEKIGPITAAVGLQPPAVRAVEVHEQKPGSGGEPELVQVVTLPGLDADGFHEMDEEILTDGRAPEAVTFHVNGPTEGGWCVVDAWTSKEARDRFMEEQVKPAAEGSALTGPPELQDLAVEATLREGAPAAV